MILLVGAALCAKPLSYRIIDSIPHNPQSFTQGLIYHEGKLLESTGSTGRGTMVIVIDPTTGKELKATSRTTSYFGEGLATDGCVLFQLSWQQGQIHLFTWPNLASIGAIPLQGEGWGLAFWQDTFYLSNGSDTLYLYNKYFSKVLQKKPIMYQGKPLDLINELEYVEGEIYANRWFSDTIFVIDPRTGTITNTIDFTKLSKRNTLSQENVLNGVAYRAKNQFYITGKMWQWIYLVEIK